MTYSYSISGEAHQIAACFDACTVTEIKIYDKVPDDMLSQAIGQRVLNQL